MARIPLYMARAMELAGVKVKVLPRVKGRQKSSTRGWILAVAHRPTRAKVKAIVNGVPRLQVVSLGSANNDCGLRENEPCVVRDQNSSVIAACRST